MGALPGLAPFLLLLATHALALLLIYLPRPARAYLPPRGWDSAGTACNATVTGGGGLCTCADVWVERVSATPRAGCVTSREELTATCGALLLAATPSSDAGNETANGTNVSAAVANATNATGTAAAVAYASPVYIYDATNFSLSDALLTGPACAVPAASLLAGSPAQSNTTSTARPLSYAAVPTTTAVRNLFEEFQIARTYASSSIKSPFALATAVGDLARGVVVAANENCSLTHGYLQARRSVCRLCAPGLELHFLDDFQQPRWPRIIIKKLKFKKKFGDHLPRPKIGRGIRMSKS